MRVVIILVHYFGKKGKKWKIKRIITFLLAIFFRFKVEKINYLQFE